MVQQQMILNQSQLFDSMDWIAIDVDNLKSRLINVTTDVTITCGMIVEAIQTMMKCFSLQKMSKNVVRPLESVKTHETNIKKSVTCAEVSLRY
jgi:hypothetical protein